ncbi:MAG: ATP-dependent DNA helicase RecG [Lachnospiraceae bacterium]|nr:ATP-dependent DNA helicase RecG [Lachnospiraceae bacterium]
MQESSSITAIKGIGEKTRAVFEKVGVFSVRDLLRYYPRDYETFGQPVEIAALQEEGVQTVCGTLQADASVRRVRGLQIVNARIADGSGRLSLVWFNMPYLKNALRSGSRYVFRGKVVRKGSGLTMDQPLLYSPDRYREMMGTRYPVYRLTKGLTNRLVADAVKQALAECDLQTDPLPEEVRREFHLAEINFALQTIHFPRDEVELNMARRRLVFEEFFYFILALRILREGNERAGNDFPAGPSPSAEALVRSLPYDLTGAQKKVWKEICADLSGPSAMNRLIQGDVGSGKTVVALMALLAMTDSGRQGALMAPTEVLAAQHARSIREQLAKAGIEREVTLLTGSMTAKEKREARVKIGSGEADIIVGTHAVFQEQVVFHDLGLVITDEQHRFGVRQRETLSEKSGGGCAHVLVMSATPIPRTLAIILYGDLDISVLDEMPAERRPVKNAVIGPKDRAKAYAFLEKEIAAGRQAYVICAMVEEGEMNGVENVAEYSEKLREALPGRRILSLHGRMKGKEKREIMEAFAAGQADVLVSTTVVEVGVNVPNATVMMIENAERFGLAQLHQLRGRVGRGADQSYCIFVNGSEEERQNKRLEVLRKSNDGFFIASEDLRMRGPGDFFGVRQSGVVEFAIGDVFTDADILKAAGECVTDFLKRDPGLSEPGHEALRGYLDKYLAEGIGRVNL